MSRSWKPSRDLLRQARELNQGREFRVLGRPKTIRGALSRTRRSKEAIDSDADAAMRALVELFSDTKLHRRYRRYVLVRGASGELEFQQEPVSVMMDEAFAEAFGRAKPRRPRLINFDRPNRK